MKTQQPSWDQIAAYLAGEMSPQDIHAFETWLHASKENELYVQEAKAIWKNSSVQFQLTDTDTESEWQRLEGKMTTTRSMFGEKIWMKVAASVAVIALAVYAIIVFNVEDNILITAGDNVETIYLPDSSRVWLNAKSSISYSKEFNKENRIVTLSGEGYFDVRHQDGQSFTVATSEASIEVLGTTFNIKEDSSVVTLSVTKGKVILSPIGKKGQEISGGESATVKDEEVTAKQQTLNLDYASWRSVRNPRYELERSQVSKFLNVKFAWRKNAINQSVIEGSVLNTASLAEYSNVILDVTYSNLNGSSKTVQLKLDESIRAGESILFTKRLFDIFKDTQRMEVKVVSAEVLK